jgi:hypothetical protein
LSNSKIRNSSGFLKNRLSDASAVQYNNSLSFSLPLLKGEVNIVDLMLVEALKIFYPTYYQFLKINSSYFLNSYSSQTLKFSLTDRSPEVRKKELEEHFERLEKTLSKNEGICVKSLLINLFPRLNEAFKNRFIQNGETEWYKNKRIVSPSYFNRYFSYSVPKGEISDVLFEDFISKIIDYSTDEIKENIFSFIQSSSVDNFLSKLRSLEDEYDWNTSVKLAKSISLLGDSFPENRSFFGIDSPKSQAAIFIYQVIKKHNIELESFNLALELMNIAQPFEFAYEINNWLRTGETEKDKIFVVSQYQELAKALIDRSLNESGETPIYIKFDKNITYLLPVWKEIDCDGFNEYITKTLSANPKNVVDLLRAFTPIVFASNSPEPYKTNFSKEQYHFFNSIFDKNMINKLIIELFSEELYKEKARFPDLKNEQTDINIVRQYKHWYDKENEDNNTSDN